MEEEAEVIRLAGRTGAPITALMEAFCSFIPKEW
jgi:hypothetical protein